MSIILTIGFFVIDIVYLWMFIIILKFKPREKRLEKGILSPVVREIETISLKDLSILGRYGRWTKAVGVTDIFYCLFFFIFSVLIINVRLPNLLLIIILMALALLIRTVTNRIKEGKRRRGYLR